MIFLFSLFCVILLVFTILFLGMAYLYFKTAKREWEEDFVIGFIFAGGGVLSALVGLMTFSLFLSAVTGNLS